METPAADRTERIPGRRRLAPTVAIAALVAYVVSLGLPAFHLAGGRSYAGVGALLFGPLGLLSAVEWSEQPHKIGYLAWLANPAFGLALVLVALRQRRAAVAAATGALLLAPSTLLLESLLVDEGGGRAAIEALGSGFWTWLGALALAWIAALLLPAPAAR